MILDKVNSLDQAEIPLLWNRAPNGTLKVIKHIIHKLLDHERPALNLGAYTCRDLDYLKPICRSIKKPIECVESWSPVDRTETKQQLIDEIESKYGHEGITYTWEDAHQAKTIDTADYVLFSTSWDYPIENTMLTKRHPTVWINTGAPYLWPRIGQALYRGDLHLVFRCECIAITNCLKLKTAFMHTLDQISLPQGWQWELGGELVNLRRDESMLQRWRVINDLSL